MAKIQSTLLICLILGVLVSSSHLPFRDFGSAGNDIEVVEIENIEDFKLANPDVKVIPLEKQKQNGQARSSQPIRYTLGNRIPSDRLLVQGGRNLQYPTLQDVSLQLSYPQVGVGGILTFIEIIVQQSSGNGQAYIVAGGIGQRFVRIIVEAKQTGYFNYQAAFYGY